MRFPITSYKEDPNKNQFAEYHEVTYALDAKAGGFVLIDLHGWWEHQEGRAILNRRVLSEPHKSVEQADAAMTERVKWLRDQGWTFQLTTEFDPGKGGFVALRIS